MHHNPTLPPLPLLLLLLVFLLLPRSSSTESCPYSSSSTLTRIAAPHNTTARLVARSAAVSLDGAQLVLGSPTFDSRSAGRVLVYVRTDAEGGAVPEWRLNATLYDPFETGFGDELGRVVAMDAGGLTLAASAPNADPSRLNEGELFVYSRASTSSSWSRIAILTSTGSSHLGLGRSLALSGDGLTLAAGGNGDDSGRSSVHVYWRTNTSVTAFAQLPLVRSTPVASNDQFGDSVSLSGDGLVLAVGASETNKIYTFTRSGVNESFTQQSVISDDPSSFEALGVDLQLSSDGLTLAVASFTRVLVYDRDDRVSSWTSPQELDSSEGYVSLTLNGLALLLGPDLYERASTNDAFTLSGSVGFTDHPFLSQDTLTVVDVSSSGVTTYARASTASTTWIESERMQRLVDPEDGEFGYATALSADGLTLAVGAPLLWDGKALGSVFVYERASITAPVSLTGRFTDPTGSSGDELGVSVALSADGRALCAGAHRDNTVVLSSVGSVSCFWRATRSKAFDFVSKFTHPSPVSFDNLGAEISMSADGLALAVSGERRDDVAPGAGAVIILTRSSISDPFALSTVLFGDDIGSADGFGNSVAMSGNGLVVIAGAQSQNNPETDSGAAYIFSRANTSTSTWTQDVKLVPSDADERDNFGSSVSIDFNATRVIIGAYRASILNSNQGVAYTYFRNATGSWNSFSKLSDQPGTANAYFGDAVAVSGSGETFTVGAWGEDANTGGVYVYNYVVAVFPLLARVLKTTPPGVDVSVRFGSAVALSHEGDVVAIGARQENGVADKAGAVYLRHGCFTTYLVNSTECSCYPCPVGSSCSLSSETLCAAGQFNAEEAQLSCKECGTGSWSSATGASECQDCASGRFSNATGAVSNATCQACPAGETSGPAADACAKCSPGRYSDTPGIAECTACPAGRASSELGASSLGVCSECVPGRYAPQPAETVCSPCPTGRYQAIARASTCLLCGRGTYLAAVAAIDIDECQDCPAGTFLSFQGASNDSQCEQCPSGRFGAAAGMGSCEPCPPGTYLSEEGQTSSAACVECPMGKASAIWGAGDELSCTACPLGSYASVNGSRNCTTCPAGSIANITASTSCISCSLGTIEREGTVCDPCPRGFFSDDPADPSCQRCASGSASDREGASVCTPCSDGHFSGSGDRCEPCPVGTFGNVSSLAECYECPAGYVSSSGQTECTQCAQGKLSRERRYCEACPKGFYSSDPTDSQCTRCPVGKFSNVTSSVECTECAAGSASANPGTVVCRLCPEGTFTSSPGADECEPCSPASVTDGVGQTECRRCENGTLARERRFCQECPLGRFSVNPADVECMACARGEFASDTGSTTCALCDPGTVSELEGSAVCTPCGLGKFASGSGKWECLDCADNAITPAVGSSECMPCSPNIRLDVSTCGQCAAGRFALGEECVPCDRGTFSNSTGAVNCTKCPVGRFADAPGQTLCRQCRPGRFSPALRAVECVRCPLGRFQGEFGAANCSDCARGRFAATTGLSRCSECTPGSFSSLGAQITCRPCGLGRFSDVSGSTACRTCGSREYADEEGLVECKGCGGGSIVTSDHAECRPCQLGEYSSNGDACVVCSAGYHAPSPDVEACVACAPGRSANSSGHFECALCPAGTYAGDASPTCNRCPIGRVSAAPGAFECDECQAGRFADESGLTACSLCAPGYAPREAQLCAACDPGFFSDASTPTCVACGRGKFADRPASESCRECPAGRFQPSPQQATCLACPVGRFSNSSGSFECELCPLNTFAAAEGSTECDECPRSRGTCLDCARSSVASNRTGRGADQCDECEAGKYAVVRGSGRSRSITCSACPRGSSCAGGTAVADENVWVVTNLVDGSVESVRCLPGRCRECSADEVADSSAAACCTSNRQPAESNPMCARCADGYVEWANECIECEETNQALLAAMLCVLLLFVLLLHFVLYQASNPFTRIFFYYSQLCLLQFGEETYWLAWTSFYNFSPITSASGGACVAPWDGIDKLLIMAWTPLICGAFLLLILAIKVVLFALSKSAGHATPWWVMLSKFKRSGWAMMLFCFQSMATASIRFFECDEIAGGRWSVVRSSPDIDCRSDEYERARGVFAVSLLLAMSIPVALVLYLRRDATRSLALNAFVNKRDEKVRAVAHASGVLYDVFDLRPGPMQTCAYYWSVVVLLRRTVVITVTVVFVKFGHELRYASLTMANLLVLVAHVYVRPFRRTTLRGDRFIDSDEEAAAARKEGRTVVDPNTVESVSLVLLTGFSAAIGATEPPFSTRQAIGYSVTVFAWLFVLKVCVLSKVVLKLADRCRRGKSPTKGGLELSSVAMVSRGGEQEEDDIVHASSSMVDMPGMSVRE